MSLRVKVPVAWFGPGALVRHAAVVCEGGRVTYAGPSAAAPHADDLLEVDGFLMPGVADRHVHLRLADPGAAAGGYPTSSSWAPSGTGRELAGPEDAAAAVAELADHGAAAIKVSLNSEAGPTPSDAELAAVSYTHLTLPTSDLV